MMPIGAMFLYISIWLKLSTLTSDEDTQFTGNPTANPPTRPTHNLVTFSAHVNFIWIRYFGILPSLTIWLNYMAKVQRDSTSEEKILEAARKVFIAKGMAGARMQDIADEAGINKALLHY